MRRKLGSNPSSPQIKDLLIMSIEKLVADAILERKTSVEIDGREYLIAPPTIGTLILVSELIAELPEVRRDVENILIETLRTARDCKVVGKIVATLILGAKRIDECRSVVLTEEHEERRFSWRKLRFERRITTTEREVNELDYLSDLVLKNCSAATLTQIVSQRLIDMGVADFFGLTTSLSAANLLKSTKEEVVEIQSGE